MFQESNLRIVNIFRLGVCTSFVCFTIDCTRKWIGNAVQNISSSSVRSRDKIAVYTIYSSVLSPEVDESTIQLPTLLLVVQCVSPLEV